MQQEVALNLYEMSREMESILLSIEIAASSDEGVIPDDLAIEIEALEGEKAEKCLNICRVIKNLTADSDAIAAEIKSMAARKKSKERSIDWLKSYLSTWAKGEKYEDANTALTWRKSASVIIDDDLLVPDAQCIFKREPSKTEIKKAIASGEVVLYAHIAESLNPQIK